MCEDSSKSNLDDTISSIPFAISNGTSKIQVEKKRLRASNSSVYHIRDSLYPGVVSYNRKVFVTAIEPEFSEIMKTTDLFEDDSIVQIEVAYLMCCIIKGNMYFLGDFRIFISSAPIRTQDSLCYFLEICYLPFTDCSIWKDVIHAFQIWLMSILETNHLRQKNHAFLQYPVYSSFGLDASTFSPSHSALNMLHFLYSNEIERV